MNKNSLSHGGTNEEQYRSLSGYEYLDSLMPWTAKEKFDLRVVKQIVEYLGMPQDLTASIHVAGTNGKGSTSTAIAAILASMGQAVGLNTSPHLERFSERFVVDGNELSDTEISRALEQVKAATKKLSCQASYHEAVTIAAFILFKSVNWAVYEVGLGGLLDASNVLTSPKVSIITSIGYDHQNILGSTIEQIAAQKAGIIKPNCPVVIGYMPSEAINVIKAKAIKEGCYSYCFGSEFAAKQMSEEVIQYQDDQVCFSFSTTLSGSHQLSNIACAIKAGLLAGANVDQCKFALSNMFWPGRLEKLVYRNKNIVLDCAHNIDGIRALTENNAKRRDNQLIILGFLRRPELHEMLRLVVGTWKQVVVLSPPTERAVPSSEVAQILSCSGVNVVDFDCRYEEALAYATNTSADEILICGSIYLVGAIRALFNIPSLPLWKVSKKILSTS